MKAILHENPRKLIHTKNNNIMKFTKFLATAAIAAIAFFSSCEEIEQLGAASVSLDDVEINLTAESGASATVSFIATRDWKVNGIPDWLTLDPSQGSGSNSKQTVKITAKYNPDIERMVNLIFTIGFSEAVLKVIQSGEAGSVAEALVYKNDFDKEVATQTYGTEKNKWPYLDQFEGWKNETGNGIANVSYEFKGASCRANSTSDGKYSHYSGSGNNNLLLGSLFAIKNIAVDGKTSFKLTFGGDCYKGSDAGTDNTFNPEEFKVLVSVDGSKGVSVPYAFDEGTNPVGVWDKATCKFAVPEGTEQIFLVFKTSVSSNYRLDDVELTVSGGAAALDFSQAEILGLDMSGEIPDGDDVTALSEIVQKPAGTNVTILNTIVTAVTTKGFVISDGQAYHIYVYTEGSPVYQDASAVKIGDKISLIGTFKYYWGEYEITGASFKKIADATAVYPAVPNEINATFLSRAKSTAAVDEESTGYTGTWYPIYAHVNATVVKKDGYTNFVVADSEDKISLVSAPADMFKDESGIEYSDGNEVELLGYYGGWVAPTETREGYHQFIAVSLTGKATYKPVASVVAGDDIFVAENEAHDRNIANQQAFTYPLVIGDASITFAGASNTGKYYTSGTSVRMGYANTSTLKIESKKPITKIEYLFADKDSYGIYYPVAGEDGSLPKLFEAGSCTFNEQTRILTWTGNAMEVVLTYPLTSGHYRIQQIGIAYGDDSAPRLSVTPATLSVAAEVESATFKVQSNTAWSITCDKERVRINPSSGQNDAEITVSFAKNESDQDVVMKFTVSGREVSDAVVTLTQSKVVPPTDLATITAITEANKEVEVIGATVVAVNNKGFIISDGTNHVYVYKGSDTGVEIGDVVNVSGKIGQYHGGYQIGSPTVTKTGVKKTPVYGTPTEITAVYSTYSNENKHAAYVSFEGIAKVGSYVNIYFQADTNPYASFMYLPTASAAGFEDGAPYKCTGFVTGKSSDYHEVIYVSSQKSGDASPVLKVETNPITVAASETGAEIKIISNVAWTATLDEESAKVAQLGSAAGATGTTVSGEGSGRVMVAFAANTSEEVGKQYKVVISTSVEGVSPVEVLINQEKAPAQGGGGETPSGSWVRVTSVDQITAGTYIIGYEAEVGSGVIVPLRSDMAAAKTTANGILYTGTAVGTTTSNSGTIDMKTIKDTKNYEVGMGPSSSVEGAKCIKLGELGLAGAPKSSNTARLYTADCANTAYVITAKDNNTFQFYCAAGKGSSEWCYFQYNASSPRFANYTGSQKNPVIYKYVAAE